MAIIAGVCFTERQATGKLQQSEKQVWAVWQVFVSQRRLPLTVTCHGTRDEYYVRTGPV